MNITPVGGFFAFEITPAGILATETKLTPGGVLDKAIKELSWEKLLDQATGGIQNAIAEQVLSKILGPSDWERDVSSKLEEIIGKLDDMLDEIRELRVYINESQRQMWRDTLHAKLKLHILGLTSFMAGARATGTLEGNELVLFTLQANSLYDGLAEIAFMTPDSPRPDGVPLYAAVQAGLLMLIVSHRILGIQNETTKNLLSRFVSVFSMWHKKIQDQTSAKTLEVQAEISFFNNFPLRGALSVGDESGGGFLRPDSIDRFAVYVIIDGGVDRPYTFVNYEFVPFKTTEYDPSKFTFFPLPYPSWSHYVDPRTGFCGGAGQAGYLAIHMCNMLNARRLALLESIENVRKLQLVVTGLADAEARFANLLP